LDHRARKQPDVRHLRRAMGPADDTPIRRAGQKRKEKYGTCRQIGAAESGEVRTGGNRGNGEKGRVLGNAAEDPAPAAKGPKGESATGQRGSWHSRFLP